MSTSKRGGWIRASLPCLCYMCEEQPQSMSLYVAAPPDSRDLSIHWKKLRGSAECLTIVLGFCSSHVLPSPWQTEEATDTSLEERGECPAEFNSWGNLCTHSEIQNMRIPSKGGRKALLLRFCSAVAILPEASPPQWNKFTCTFSCSYRFVLS